MIKVITIITISNLYIINI